MKKILWTILLSTAIAIVAPLVSAQTDEPDMKLSDNKLIYTPKYVDGQELADLLFSLADGMENCDIRYFESFNTIVITAPKETLGMFSKLLQKYDKMPEKALLKCYLLKTSTKGHLEQSVLDAIKPALDQLKQFDLRNGFELIGSSLTPLLINKSRDSFITLLGSETQANLNYHLSLDNIVLTSETLTIGELSLIKISADRHPDVDSPEELSDDLISGSFTTKFGESTVIIKGTKSNALILIFILEKTNR